jgi:hypothetical protein
MDKKSRKKYWRRREFRRRRAVAKAAIYHKLGRALRVFWPKLLSSPVFDVDWGWGQDSIRAQIFASMYVPPVALLPPDQHGSPMRMRYEMTLAGHLLRSYSPGEYITIPFDHTAMTPSSEQSMVSRRYSFRRRFLDYRRRMKARVREIRRWEPMWPDAYRISQGDMSDSIMYALASVDICPT